MREQLLARFGPVLSTSALALFRTLVEQVERFEDGSGGVVCHFPGVERRWVLSRPFLAEREATRRVWDEVVAYAPKALRELLTVCASLEFGEVGDTGQLVLSSGFSGTAHAEGPDIVNEGVFPFTYSKHLCSPIDIDSGDFYLVHPDDGRLLFQTEGNAYEVVDTADPVEIYFRELHYSLRNVCEDTPFRRAFLPARHRTSWLRDRALVSDDDEAV